jgi:hypothetical protein
MERDMKIDWLTDWLTDWLAISLEANLTWTSALIMG